MPKLSKHHDLEVKGLVVLILLLHFPTLWVVLVIWCCLVASKGAWAGVKGNCWEMKSMGPCFRPGWARLGVGSCHFICRVDPTQSLEDVVFK